MNSIIQTLQRVNDTQMKIMLHAVIADDEEALARIAAALQSDPKQVGFLVIAECANRWLTSQP